MLDDEDCQQFRDVVAVGHVGFALIVQRREELARRRFAFFELGYLVELRAGHGEVRLRLVYRGRLTQFGVQEEGEKGHGDDVSSDSLLVIFSHSELVFPEAGISDQRVEAR